MTILKNSDGKIIINNSGEILTKSDALVVLRSTFGLTKDVSNNVNRVKFYNTPSKVVRQENTSIQPVENGDGFDFSNGSVLPINYLFDFTSASFMVQFWGKNASGGLAQILGQHYVASGSDRPWYFLQENTPKLSSTFTIRKNIDNSLVTVTCGSANGSDVWVHITGIVYRKNGTLYLAGLKNGVITDIYSETEFDIEVSTKPILIGSGRDDASFYNFEGDLDDVEIYVNEQVPDISSAIIGDEILNVPIRSSE